MWRHNPSDGVRGPSRKRRASSVGGPKRRNKTFVTVDIVLSKALDFIQRADPSGSNRTLEFFASNIRTCQTSMNQALVTLDEATIFAEAYADYYLGLANGVLVPPQADVYFEGTMECFWDVLVDPRNVLI